MLRRTIVDETAHPTPSYTSPYMRMPRQDEMSQANVEDYLDHYCAPLVGKVPYEERVRLREEMRTQIESVVAAHVELGSSREQAIALTLRQFGPPQAAFAPPVVHYDLPAAQQARPVRPKGVWFGVFSFGLAMVLQAMTIAAAEGAGPGGGMIIITMLAAFPFLAGLALGYRRPDRTLRVMFRAMTWLAVPSVVATMIAMSDGGGHVVFPMAIAGFALNMIFGGVGARLGATIHRSGLMDRIDPPFDNKAASSRQSAFGNSPYHTRVENGTYRMP